MDAPIKKGKTCEQKKTYFRLFKAAAAADKFKHGKCEAYHCATCGYYHIGHPRGWMWRRLNRV